MRHALSLTYCALIASALLVSSNRPAHAAPTTSATFAVGVGEPTPFFTPDQPHGLMAELKLRATGRDVGAFVEVRNSFYDGAYLFRKSRVKAGLDFPLTRSATVFVEYENSYRTGDAWGWAGVRFNLFRL